ncbi:MAG TPA: hypothetical protein PLG15_01930 [Candidatus Gastranaerophilaceae bacterium]|nr:hypothetical protein [Candidatus Gastranaerophilaceae bacterium]HPT41123.1 hypothetical protein [Candidatus Gastranaerophilaceae bacterium]
MTTVDKSDVIKVAKPNVGVIVPPNDIPNPEIYSDKEARKKFKELHKDVFESQNKLKRHSDAKNFRGLLISTGIVGVFYLLAKNLNRLRIF